jgi:hypothetical protein
LLVSRDKKNDYAASRWAAAASSSVPSLVAHRPVRRRRRLPDGQSRGSASTAPTAR